MSELSSSIQRQIKIMSTEIRLLLVCGSDDCSEAWLAVLSWRFAHISVFVQHMQIGLGENRRSVRRFPWLHRRFSPSHPIPSRRGSLAAALRWMLMPLPLILIVADWLCCHHGFGVWPHLSSFWNVAPHCFTLLVSARFTPLVCCVV